MPANTRPLSWIRPSVLWRARNDVIARRLHDPTDEARAAWVRMARERALATAQDRDFVFRVGAPDRASFVLLGDTGEGHDSQYAVVPDLLARAGGVDLAVICSDVNYPTGDSADYRERFYRPYRSSPSRSSRCRATTTGTTALSASCTTSAASTRRATPCGPVRSAAGSAAGCGARRRWPTRLRWPRWRPTARSPLSICPIPSPVRIWPSASAPCA